jgi:hypothetical protein
MGGQKKRRQNVPGPGMRVPIISRNARVECLRSGHSTHGVLFRCIRG